MNGILRASKRTVMRVGRGWKFIGRSFVFNGSNNDFGFLSGGVNLVCFVGLPLTIPGVIIFTGIALPIAAIGGIAGGAIEGVYSAADVAETVRERREERRLERAAQEAPWLRRRQTILTRVFLAQVFHAHGVPKDVTEMFTKDIYPRDAGGEVIGDLTPYDYKLFAKHNREIVDKVYHNPKYTVQCSPD